MGIRVSLLAEIIYRNASREMLNGVKDAWQMMNASPKIGNISKKFPIFGETLLLHLKRTMQPFEKVSYYLGKTKCDFVLQREDAVSELIQVCWDMSSPETRSREVAGLVEASEVTGCDNLTIVTNGESSEMVNEGKTIRVVPAWKWLLSAR